MLIAVDPHLRQFTWLGVLGYAIFQIAPLIFTLALAYRWQITVKSSVAMAAGSETWKDLYPVEHAV